IQRLRDAVEMVVYTPGSSAGIPVSILKSFAVPDKAVMEDGELLRERIGTTATSLLSLLNIDADPIQSREHILLSTIIHWSWSQGKDLDLAALIGHIQNPPVTKIGVLDLESFYPGKERFGLVMALNNLLAAPGFGAWMEGEPLDIRAMLYTGDGPSPGKPRISIFSIAHLNDAERMFFVSLLLNQVLGWMRTQSGTTSLRAILYMDEIFGYFPPTANPPSKQPLLTLMKQARAFGLGVVLVTQNPVDLDYKGLSNAGTWFIGRLQTDRDKQRVLDGLEGASVTAGSQFDRAQLDNILSSLGNRIFLMNNVHDDGPTVFETRWAMSYLRGPLTREQIRKLMEGRREASAGQPVTAPVAASSGIATSAAFATSTVTPSARRPSLPPDIPQFFIPTRGTKDAKLIYRPMLFGAAKINFVDAKTRVDVMQDAAHLTPITDAAVPVNWDDAKEAGVAASDLERDPTEGGQFEELPPSASKAKNYAAWSKDFVTYVYGTQTLELFRSPSTKEISQLGESERDFRVRVQQSAREARDAAVEKLKQKYAPKLTVLQERLRKAQQAVEVQEAQAKQAQFSTAVSVGASLLSAFIGGRGSALNKAGTAAKGVGKAMKEGGDIGRAKETVEAVQQQLTDLDEQFKAESAELESTLAAQSEALETLSLKPKKTNIAVQLVALAWVPFWVDANGAAEAAWG
ncbi:MAG: ATP-binding protein, partial [Anaerolineales bacterium]